MQSVVAMYMNMCFISGKQGFEFLLALGFFPCLGEVKFKKLSLCTPWQH